MYLSCATLVLNLLVRLVRVTRATLRLHLAISTPILHHRHCLVAIEGQCAQHSCPRGAWVMLGPKAKDALNWRIYN